MGVRAQAAADAVAAATAGRTTRSTRADREGPPSILPMRPASHSPYARQSIPCRIGTKRRSCHQHHPPILNDGVRTTVSNTRDVTMGMSVAAQMSTFLPCYWVLSSGSSAKPSTPAGGRTTSCRGWPAGVGGHWTLGHKLVAERMLSFLELEMTSPGELRSS